jgi:hypothetical protein
MKRLFVATLIGAFVAFLWGFASWELLPWHKMGTFEDDAAISQAIKDNTPEHGIYMLPRRGAKGLDAEAITKGPLVYAVIRPGQLDHPWMLKHHLVRSFLIQLFSSLILATTVYKIKASRFVSRAAVGIVMGLFAGVSSTLPFWNWFELPSSRVLVHILDPFICWTLAGLCIAAILKPPGPRKIFT